MDTAGIVEQLMAIEKQPYDRLDVKKQTEQLRLQAFQAVNTMLLKFRNSVQNLSSQKLWNSKTASSTNENSLTATASQYAVNGTYSFRVAQMATATQYMSKGFSDTKATFGQPNANGTYNTLGNITLSSAKTRVDNSAKLEELNGGKGVYRGSIRITDAKGNSSVVDVSGCVTINDVVSTINNAGGIQVQASIDKNANGESVLKVADTSGGTGALKIQNVGTGTTARDLGLTVESSDATGASTITGNSIYYMTKDTELSSLRDGLGVEQGKITIYVDDPTDGKGQVVVDLGSAKTLGDIIDTINTSIAGSGYSALDDLKVGLNDARNGLQFSGVRDGATYVVYNGWEGTDQAYNSETAQQLGIGGSFVGDASGVHKGERLLGDPDSPMLKNLTGNNGTGVGASGTDGQSRVPYGPLDAAVPLEYLNNGQGISIGKGLSLKFYENGGTGSRTLDNLVDNNVVKQMIDDGKTLGDLVSYINDRITHYADNENYTGLKGMSLSIEDGGIVVNGASAAHAYGFEGDLAASLGLSMSHNGGNLLEGRDVLSDEFQDALDDLYKTENIKTSNADIFDTTKLGDLKAVGHTGAIRDIYDPANPPVEDDPDTPDVDESDPGVKLGLKTFIDENSTDGFVVKIGGVEYNLTDAVKNLTDDSTIGDFFTAVNDELAAQTGGAAPYLYYDWLATGFQWRNVDIGESFEVTGSLAEAFGLNKSYDPAALTDPTEVDAAIVDTPRSDLNATMPGYTQSLYPFDENNVTTITLGDLNGGRGLSLKGDASDTFDVTFTMPATDTDPQRDVTVSVSKQAILDALAADFGHANPSAASVDEYVQTLNKLVKAGIDEKIADGDLDGDAAFEFAVNDFGLTVAKAYGGEDGAIAELNGALVTNGTWGLGNVKMMAGDPDGEYEIQISYLNPAKFIEQEVEGIGSMTVKVGGNTYTLNTDGITGESSLRDLMDKLNSELAANGVSDISFVINSSGTGLAVDNASNKDFTVVNSKDANTLARDLGLLELDGSDKTVEAFSIVDGGTLGRKVVDRSTTLTSLAGSKTLSLGSIEISNTLGRTYTIPLDECKTIGDVVDAINQLKNIGLRASVNATGDGISFVEYWEPGNEPEDSLRVSNIKISDTGSGNIADILGIAKTGTGYVSKEVGYAQQKSSLTGSINKSITITGSDTLESVMNKLSEMGYKTAIINDGSGANPYRLSISSANTGEAADFVLSTNLDFLGLTQTSRGKDSKVLYGDPNSGVSPIMLSSSTNSNSTAILGLTLDIKQTSDTYTTITVDTDKSQVVEEFKNLAQTYNDLNDLISYLDGYDPETNEPGVLFGDVSLRNLMKSIDDMFYEVYNPGGWTASDKDSPEKYSWTWMDLGISFGTNNTNSDGKSGSWYSTMNLDLEVLESMVASNWDNLYNALASQQNVTNSKLAGNAAASASFNFQYDRDPVTGELIIPPNQSNPNGAITNDYSTTMANGNGFQANKTIAQGENQYTVWFQGTSTISRLSLYHPDAMFVPGYGTGNVSLKDFTVEYLDANTGKWETLREVTDNASNANHFGLPVPTAMQAIRITASSTNAADGVFRLLDVQAYENTGLAGKLNELTTSLGDVTTGFMAERTTEIEAAIKDIEDRMEKLLEKLDAKETALWRQFTAMETALGKLQNQGNQLTSMLGSLSSSSS